LGDSKIEDLLLKLLEEMAIVKSKLEVLDELKIDSKNINARVDKIEAMNERHNDSIYKLEHRANVMEQYQRDKMVDSKKQMTSVYISMGMAVFGAILSVVMNLF
jgi:hypothetical protein